MDYRDIPIGIRKMWLRDSYEKRIITKKEYEQDLKDLIREIKIEYEGGIITKKEYERDLKILENEIKVIVNV